MRSYGQFCSVARALDVIGDRWNLLIVRELMLRGQCRYTDLREGLPGIATNLLADRLRELEQAGVVERRDAPPPIATTVFELAERGRKLEPVIRELGRWGVELMPDTDPRLAFRSYWLEFPVGLYLTDRRPDSPPITIEVRVGEDPMVIETVDGEVRSHPGSVADPDVVLGGPAPALLGLVTGKLSLAGARNRGLRVEGDLEALGRVLPDPVAS